MQDSGPRLAGKHGIGLISFGGTSPAGLAFAAETWGPLDLTPRPVLPARALRCGAHQSQICDAVYATHLLSHWVRDRGALTVEAAIWRLTGHPATTFGFADRGFVRPGLVADLVAFDPQTVAAGPLERVHDLPAGADRLVSKSVGIEYVWVNGTLIRAAGKPVTARPGW